MNHGATVSPTSSSAGLMCSISAPDRVRCCEGSKNPIAEATATAVSSASPVIMHIRVEHACTTPTTPLRTARGN